MCRWRVWIERGKAYYLDQSSHCMFRFRHINSIFLSNGGPLSSQMEQKRLYSQWPRWIGPNCFPVCWCRVWALQFVTKLSYLCITLGNFELTMVRTVVILHVLHTVHGVGSRTNRTSEQLPWCRSKQYCSNLVWMLRCIVHAPAAAGGLKRYDCRQPTSCKMTIQWWRNAQTKIAFICM